jgi:hypothetical protein
MARVFTEDAIKMLKQSNTNRLLVDVRSSPSVQSSVEQYLLATRDVNQFGLDRNSRIAVLVKPGDRSHDFVETVFRNAGYRFRLFHDEDSALEWLGELR